MDTYEKNASSGRIQNNHFNQLCSSCSNYLANHCTCVTLAVHLHSLASVLVVLSLNQLQLTCRYVDIDIAFPVAKSTYLVAYIYNKLSVYQLLLIPLPVAVPPAVDVRVTTTSPKSVRLRADTQIVTLPASSRTK